MRTTSMTILAVLLSTAAHGDTLLVDPEGGGDFTEIQPAVQAAAVGDTVLVAPGTYAGASNTGIDFQGKDLVLRSSSGAEATVIDGEGLAAGFDFSSTETSLAVVEGFTITNTGGSGPFSMTAGSSPTIRDCVISANHVSGSGGGVSVQSASPIFQSCTIVENQSGFRGGGISIIDGSPTFTGCWIVGNHSWERGGGVWIQGNSSPTFTRCTITGNRADDADAGWSGGGIEIVGSALPTLNQTILWGNRAATNDDLAIGINASVSMSCTNIDPMGVGGAGSINDLGGNFFTDPHFCDPQYCQRLAWTHGDYELAANSPCLAANSPCGQGVGAGSPTALRGPVVVWTGAAGTTSWENPLNWSTLAVPDSTDDVQITKGSVVLSSSAHVATLNHCPESAAPDTFRVLTGAVLAFGSTSGSLRDAEKTSTSAGNWDWETDSQAIVGGTDPDLTDLCIADEATFQFNGTMNGTGEVAIKGLFFADPGSLGVGPMINVPFSNDGLIDPGPLARSSAAGDSLGIVVLSGTLTFADSLKNNGLVRVASGASLKIDAPAENQTSGVVLLEGNLGGTGSLSNLGSVERVGAGTSDVNLTIVNEQEVGGVGGTVAVRSGTAVVVDSLVNRSLAQVDAGATLDLVGVFHNEASGVVEVSGVISGTGTLHNVGDVQKVGAHSSSFSALLSNDRDVSSGSVGRLDVLAGTLDVSNLDNEGVVSIESGASAVFSDVFVHREGSLLEGSGAAQISGLGYSAQGVTSPGASVGELSFVGTFAPEPTAVLAVEIGGLVPGIEHDRLAVVGSVAYGGMLAVRLVDGFFPALGDTFPVITVTGGSVMPGAFDCFAGTQVGGGVFLEPVELPDRLLLVARADTLTNSPPSAAPDTVQSPLAQMVSAMPLANDSDANGDDLSLVQIVSGPFRGTAWIEPGASSVTYWPDETFVVGVDSLTYTVTDCEGGLDSAQVIVVVGDPTTAPDDATVPSIGIGRFAAAPNPTRVGTQLRFDLPRAAVVELSIYDVRGRRVKRLSIGPRDAGSHVVQWRARDERGALVAAGVYFARLQVGPHQASRKLLVLR